MFNPYTFTDPNTPREMTYVPTPKQKILHNTAVQQILFGGQVGGGKSRALRWDAVKWCLVVPGVECYLFRKTFGELWNNHIRPLMRELPTKTAKFNVGRSIFSFSNGSKIVMCYCEGPNDHLKYQGSEMHALYIDEAALFYPYQIIELRARVRLGSFSERVPEKFKKYLPRAVFSSNPGGPAHNFLRETFIAPSPPGEVFTDSAIGWSTLFLPSKLSDNPFMEESYGTALAAMDPARRKALLEGDWDCIDGAALYNLSRKVHCVKPFRLPKHWLVFMSIAWGTSTPFAVGWFAMVGEDTVLTNNPQIPATEDNPLREIHLPIGAIVMFDELYGWTGKENEGMRLDPMNVAKRILDKEATDNDNLGRIAYRVGSENMWSRHYGPSAAERMMSSTKGKITLRQIKEDNLSQYNEMLSLIVGDPFKKPNRKVDESPMLFISNTCQHAWRTVPPLSLDRLDPNQGPDPNQEIHMYRCIVNAVSSRPSVITQQISDHERYIEAKRAARVSDCYATE